MRERVTQRGLQRLGALILVTAAVIFALVGVWPFDSSPRSLPADPTLWQLMLSDQVTLGFIRLGLILLAVFVVASVPALIIGGRWIKGFGTTGLTADDAADADPRRSRRPKRSSMTPLPSSRWSSRSETKHWASFSAS